MSITRGVGRLRRLGAAVLLASTAVLVVSPVSVAASPRPQPARVGRPAAPAASQPAARILELSAIVDARQATLGDAMARRERTVRRLIEARRLENLTLAKSDELSRAARSAAVEHQRARAEAGQMAAAMYRQGGDAKTIMRLLDSESAAELAYRNRIIASATDVQWRVVKRAVTTQRAAARAAKEAAAARIHWREEVVRLAGELPERDAEVERIQGRLSNARFWLRRWETVAAGVATPIMSRSVLGPSEIVRWFTGTGRRARITVPLIDLAQAFVEEGESAGVRGDIAFAQSILETGGFYFPDGGQLTPTDNNFAGMDACDSCERGRSFPDARTGVRAQVQQLRVYADPNLTNSQLSPPPVVANLDQHHLKGEVPTWDGLTHTWATADTYGDRILQIYTGMLAWLTDRADI